MSTQHAQSASWLASLARAAGDERAFQGYLLDLLLLVTKDSDAKLIASWDPSGRSKRRAARARVRRLG